jgi:hypothetical protein
VSGSSSDDDATGLDGFGLGDASDTGGSPAQPGSGSTSTATDDMDPDLALALKLSAEEVAGAGALPSFEADEDRVAHPLW